MSSGGGGCLLHLFSHGIARAGDLASEGSGDSTTPVRCSLSMNVRWALCGEACGARSCTPDCLLPRLLEPACSLNTFVAQ